MKEKKVLLLCAAVALLVVGAVAFCLCRSSNPPAEADDGPEKAKSSRIAAKDPALRQKLPRAKRIASVKKGRADEAKRLVHEADEVELSAEDQKTVDAIQDALDDDKLEATLTLANRLVNHPVAEVRMRAVEALGWFGDKALAALTPYLADSDEEVREAASSALEQAFAQMEDEAAKLRYIESFMQIRNACSEDCLTMLSGELTGLEDSVAVVQAATRVIEANTNPSGVQTMKEVYEFVTGDEYTTREASETWCRETAAEAAEDAAAEAEPASDDTPPPEA